VLVVSCPDQRQNPIPAAVLAIVPAVIAGVSDQAADAGTDHQGAVQQMGK
jgi:hypothetical protein